MKQFIILAVFLGLSSAGSLSRGIAFLSVQLVDLFSMLKITTAIVSLIKRITDDILIQLR